MPVRLSLPHDVIKPRYDVVVVGSGYGGSIAASRLSRANKSVCLLERGRELQPGDYPDTGPEAAREFQVDTPIGRVGSRTGLFDMHIGPDISVFRGCGLGGTSLINASVAMEPDPRVFEDPRWPEQLRADQDGLRGAFQRARQMLRPRSYPEDWPTLSKVEALKRTAAQLGAGFFRPEINVNFDELPDGLNHVGMPQKPCTLCGDCTSGCNCGAKGSVLMNYLPDARAHGAEIFCETCVRRVEKAERGWRVCYQLLEAGRDAFHGPEMFVEAQVVLLGAGSLGTTEILLRSASKLPMSVRLGERFTGNGDLVGFSYNGAQAIHGVGYGNQDPELEKKHKDVVGPCIAGLMDLRGKGEEKPLEDGIVVEEGAIPGALAGLLPMSLAAAAKIFGKDKGHGAEHWVEAEAREAESLIGGAYVGAVQNTETYLVMSHDDANGQMRLEGDRLNIHWPGVGKQKVFGRVMDNLQEATATNDGTFVENPIVDPALGSKLVTVHALGGCAMADDAEHGVTDHKGEVFAGARGKEVHEGLFVCDGALMPRPLGVNPLLTISALAERAVELLAKDRGWAIDYSFSDKPRPPPSDPRKVAIEFTERMVGPFSTKVTSGFEPAAEQGRADGSELEFTLTIFNSDLEKLVADNATPSRLAGTATCKALSPQPMDATGTFILLRPDPDRVETKRMDYRMTLTSEEEETFFLEGFKLVHDDAGPDLWPDTSTLYTTVRRGDEHGEVVGRGILRIRPADFARQLTTLKVLNAASPAQRLEWAARFGEAFARSLYSVYGGALKPIRELEPKALHRKKRPLRAPAPEVHRFKTGDGLTLQLERYCDPGGRKKGPVMLSHGLGVSGRIFSLDTVDTNLVEYLCAHGYDVWNLEHRFSIDLPASKAQFSVDDLACYDYPAAVAKVLEVSGRPSLQVVAHCVGAAGFTMAMLSGLRSVRSAVISQLSAHAEVPALTHLKVGLHVPELLDAMGIEDLTAWAGDQPRWYDLLFDKALALFPQRHGEHCDNPVCHRISFLYGLVFDHQNLNALTHETLHETFGVANIRAFEQMARIARERHVVTAKGGGEYLRHPERMKIPVAFIHGADNQCFLPEGTRLTAEWLTRENGELYTRHVVPGYGHIDCILGKDAIRDVFPIALAHLEATQDAAKVQARVERTKRHQPRAGPRAPAASRRRPSPEAIASRAPAPSALQWIYRAGAISNFLVTLPAFYSYGWQLRLLHADPPRYPFLVWIWAGMAFLWGVMFWEVSRDLRGKYAMLKYTWLEKLVTSCSATAAFLTGNVPLSFLAGIALTDIIWIPLFIGVQWWLSRHPGPETALAERAATSGG